MFENAEMQSPRVNFINPSVIQSITAGKTVCSTHSNKALSTVSDLGKLGKLAKLRGLLAACVAEMINMAMTGGSSHTQLLHTVCAGSGISCSLVL